MPDEVVLQLSHKDVNLGFFKTRKKEILALRAGEQLLFNNNYLYTLHANVPVALLSQRMQADLQAWVERGYNVSGATIRFIVAWRPKDAPKEEEEHAVLLVDLSVADRPFPDIPTLVVGVDIPRDVRRERISARLRQRIGEGMTDEIRRLLDEGVAAEDLIYYGLEYKYVTEYVIGQRSYDDMLTQLEIHIHQFAKRQMTWFRGMERRGVTIHWIDGTQPLSRRVEDIITLLKI